MYIAIEGIKGAGKSTAISILQKQIENQMIPASIFQITRKMPVVHPHEQIHTIYPILKQYDPFVEFLFAQRARWNQYHMKSGNKLIVGDRSIITSYVTRWNKWNDPYYTIKRAHKLTPGIMKPKVIIWLKANEQLALQNIGYRQPKELGKREETPEVITEACAVYEELFECGLYRRKIGRAQVIQLTINQNLKELPDELLSIIKYYK